MSDLERIEAKHWGRPGLGKEYCTICGGESPCDVVKLARALENARMNFAAISFWQWEEECERVLHEVAGGDDGE